MGYDEQATGNLLTFVLFTIALPELEQAIFKEKFVKMTSTKPTPLREVDPANAELLEYWLLGKTIEDRDKDRDKKRILHAFYEAKLSVEVISKVLDIDLKSVKKIIAEAKKAGQKKSNGLNSNPKKG